jgi:ABC-type glutathione transport system ATPase component
MLLQAQLDVRYGHAAPVLRGAELAIGEGEIVGLAGQSGSGKSTLALNLLRLERFAGAAASGRLLWRGKDILAEPESQWRRRRGREIALVLQSAESALNPALRLEEQLKLAWRIHSKEPWSGPGKARAAELFAQCALPAGDEFLRRFPSQVSIGQAQRVLIAQALLHKPALLVADEVTSALDMLTSREVLDTLRRLSTASGTAILFVSHDLAAMRALCARIDILHEGRIVESAPTETLFAHPRHEYTRRLLSAMPQPAEAAAIMER